jgi:MT0933-like antitoxin protein
MASTAREAADVPNRAIGKPHQKERPAVRPLQIERAVSSSDAGDLTTPIITLEGRVMGMADRLRDLTLKAKKSAAEHKDQIQQAVEKAETIADTRTKGKYHDRIANTGAKVESYVEKLQPQGSEQRQVGGAQAHETDSETPESRPHV